MRKFVVIFAFFLMCVFYFVVPRFLGSEGYFLVNQPIILEKSNLGSQSSYDDLTKTYPFFINGTLAYFDDKFELFSLIQTDDRFSIDRSYYARYNDMLPEFTVYKASGEQIVRINDKGLPFIREGRIFSVHHIQGLLKSFDFSGELLWTYSMGSYITSLHTNGDFIVVGSMGGYVIILDRYGKLVFEYRPAGSESEIIYSSVISDNAHYFAIISGMNPQRFLLFKRGDRSYIPIYRREFKSQFSGPMRIKFSKSNDLVVYEEPEFLNGYYIKQKRAFQFPVDGELRDFDVDVLGQYLSFVSENQGKYELNVFNSLYLFPLVKVSVYSHTAVVIKGLAQFLVFGINDEILPLFYHR